MPSPQELIYWVDAQQAQQGPEPFEALLKRAAAGQVGLSTPVWWNGQDGWIALGEIEGVTLPLPPRGAVPPAAAAGTGSSAKPAQPGAAPNASAALMSGMADQELDDEFMALVSRSWELYKETEFAMAIDEAMLGGVITAMVDCGFVLIDLNTASPWAVASTATEVGSTATVGHHQLRFEEPTTHARVAVSLEHLTPDPATAKVMGHRASAIIGYGERVPNFNQVGQAVRQEVQSSFIASPEPGTVTFDADMSSGYVYAQIDLLLELERYVDSQLAVDHELLRRHLASVVYTMQTFIETRFGR
ncbi:MAG: DUF4339 domain-containing protein [Candidatus Nanopelagicales bacterium]